MDKISLKKNGFTIVELLIVIVVIAILAAISIVAYTGIQNSARSANGKATANTVSTKASIWATLKGTYPDLAQLRTNTLAPTSIDTPGGAEGPVEAKLADPSIVMGATINAVRAEGGRTVYYEPCANYAGARIQYWDYASSQADKTVTLVVGAC